MKELVDQIIDLAQKIDRAPRKSIRLQAAREHVLREMLGPRRPSSKQEWDDAVRAMDGETTTTEIGYLFGMADSQARDFLLRAFAAGEVRTRGVEQMAGQQLIMHEQLPLHWWQRIVDRPGIVSAGDEYPVHALSWLDSVIQRRKPGPLFWDDPLAIVTNIEVDHDQLLGVAKPLAWTDEDRRPSVKQRKQQAMDWLIAELRRREKVREPHGRDPMVRALRGKFKGLFTTEDDARDFISSVPKEYRARPGRPSGKPGLK